MPYQDEEPDMDVTAENGACHYCGQPIASDVPETRA